jgi:hypothetical protein
MRGDGQEKWKYRHGIPVVVQQSGVQELTGFAKGGLGWRPLSF